jgi:hypothetical protein
MTFDFAVLAPLVSGPAAATIICLIVMWYGYKLIVEKMLPAQAQMVKDILEEHRKDRKVFVDSIVLMDKRLSSVEDMDKRLSSVEEEISEIKFIVKENK